MNETLGEKYELPEDFAATVDHHVKDRAVITDRAELIAFWQSALAARKKHPKFEGSIAEWAVSCTSSSPLIDDRDILDEIHGRFGALEVYSSGNDKLWGELEKLLTEAAQV